jgi:hypothetical protein
MLTGSGALLVNLSCAFILARVRHAGGSLSRAAFLSARNDVLANVAIIGAGARSESPASGHPRLCTPARSSVAFRRLPRFQSQKVLMNQLLNGGQGQNRTADTRIFSAPCFERPLQQGAMHARLHGQTCPSLSMFPASSPSSPLSAPNDQRGQTR